MKVLPVTSLKQKQKWSKIKAKVLRHIKVDPVLQIDATFQSSQDL